MGEGGTYSGYIAMEISPSKSGLLQGGNYIELEFQGATAPLILAPAEGWWAILLWNVIKYSSDTPQYSPDTPQYSPDTLMFIELQVYSHFCT